jgi:hypothetical protein
VSRDGGSILCQACSSQGNRDANPRKTQKIARLTSGFVTILGSASGCICYVRSPINAFGSFICAAQGISALLILAFELSEGGRWLVAGVSTKESGDGDVRGVASDSILIHPTWLFPDRYCEAVTERHGRSHMIALPVVAAAWLFFFCNIGYRS